MLGYSISIYLDNNEKICFAHWETGIDGIGWIKELCRKQQCKLIFNGHFYPNKYQLKAETILPWLIKGDVPKSQIPTIMANEDGSGVLINEECYQAVKLSNREILATLDPSAYLTIEVWDLS